MQRCHRKDHDVTSLAKSRAFALPKNRAQLESKSNRSCNRYITSYVADVEIVDFFVILQALLTRWLQLRFDFDSTDVRLLMKGH